MRPELRGPPDRGERRDRSGLTAAEVAQEERAATALLTPAAGDPPWPALGRGWRHDTADPLWAFPVPFTAFDGVVLLLWGLVAQVLVGGVAVALAGDAALEDLGALWAVVAIYAVTLPGQLVVLRARGALSWRLLGPVPPGLRHAGLGLLAGAGTWVASNALLATFALLSGYEPETRQSVLERAETGGLAALALGVVVAVVLAPVVEELVHRAVLFQALRRRIGGRAAGVASAGIFAVVHLELVGEPPLLAALFLFGLVLAWVLHRTGSLVAPVTAHATYNGLTLVASVVLR